MKRQPVTIIECLVDAASAATRCRQAAIGESQEVADALMRAAARYSERVAVLADELANAGAR